MEETEKKKGNIIRISDEFREWLDDIGKEFDKQRGFIPSDTDICTNIKRQFRGKFIV